MTITRVNKVFGPLELNAHRIGMLFMFKFVVLFSVNAFFCHFPDRSLAVSPFVDRRKYAVLTRIH